MTLRHARTAMFLASVAILVAPLAAQDRFGPYNIVLVPGGDGLTKPLGAAPAAPQSGQVPAPPAPPLPQSSGWALHAWIEPGTIPAGTVLVAGVGDPGAGRFLALVDGVPALVTPAGTVLGRAKLVPGRWRFLAASFDGQSARLSVDGQEVARGAASAVPVAATVMVGPRGKAGAGVPAFAGRVAGFTAVQAPLDNAALRRLAADRPDPALIQFEAASPTWPVQVRQQYGQVVPQDAWTLPTSSADPTKPVARPVPRLAPLAERAPGRWTVNNWRLAEAPKVAEGGAALSAPDFDAGRWYAATVPGTVLTTLVDRGVYPDPAYGLNNLAIPESLNKQDYWYRTQFEVPSNAAGRHLFLTFEGINYASEVWVNGARVGTTKGAFRRGQFEVTRFLKPGARNAIAVKVSPPPHPGIAHEESLTAGVGENGGIGAIDGPAFIASEGWDWIPSVRDRNTGLWQGVELAAIGETKLGDPQVVTSLPNPDNSVAEVEISVPVQNLSDQPQTATVTAAFDGISVTKQVPLAPRATAAVKLAPAEFPQLRVASPRLWWPNGYGEQALHDLTLTSAVAGRPDDTKRLRFGIREVTYEISLMDQGGNLRRVEMDLTRARSLNQQIVDGSHTGIRKVPGGWAASLVPGAEGSPAVVPISGDEGLSPYLLLKVNGVRIAARGGNIGMDDWMKRSDRARLEPFFRLHKDAHLNIVRNWVGQNTQESFYELADEYGMMVLNDFWASTQDYQVEPQDVPLFTANAEDVIKRFRNHPSIVAWFGRNEGVPQPILNEALQSLVNAYDGTRFYMGSSNRVNLQNSGPYNWREPAEYFTTHAKGFSVELGTPSFPTLESWKRAMPAADLWPISDTWAYHDWHQTGNGGVGGYMEAMARQFGAATSVEDFERKAQMIQYDSYRAIFEGMNAGLWKDSTGRMLWMTQPAWPSSAWQIFSSDYDTHGSFYGVKKASQPVHVQMNLPDYKVILVNNRPQPLSGVTVRAKIVSLDNRVLAERQATVGAGAGLTADAFTLDLAPILAQGVALVRLEAVDASGARISDNFYWQGRDGAALQALNGLAPVTIAAAAASRRDGDEIVTTVEMSNGGTVPALAAKLTVLNGDGSQVLPAYFSDNYVSLLPGERRRVEIRYPASAAKGRTRVSFRGWNVAPAAVRVENRG